MYIITITMSSDNNLIESFFMMKHYVQKSK